MPQVPVYDAATGRMLSQRLFGNEVLFVKGRQRNRKQFNARCRWLLLYIKKEPQQNRTSGRLLLLLQEISMKTAGRASRDPPLKVLLPSALIREIRRRGFFKRKFGHVFAWVGVVFLNALEFDWLVKVGVPDPT